MGLDAVVRVRKDNARLAELKRCQTDLYYLCSEVLNYKWNPEKQQGVTEAFKACTAAEKLNLGVGAYRDDNLTPVVLQARAPRRSSCAAAQRGARHAACAVQPAGRPAGALCALGSALRCS